MPERDLRLVPPRMCDRSTIQGFGLRVRDQLSSFPRECLRKTLLFMRISEGWTDLLSHRSARYSSLSALSARENFDRANSLGPDYDRWVVRPDKDSHRSAGYAE